MEHFSIKNNEAIRLDTIPVYNYYDFYDHVIELSKNPACHCVSYFGYPEANKLKFICCIANDKDHTIHLLSYELEKTSGIQIPSVTVDVPAFHIYEREINENFGIQFVGHPWMKHVRYAYNRHDKNILIKDHPFIKVTGEETHEVGVGPIHAGIIEPGHFRFLCQGEDVLHLEIQLGYQHRGIEDLYTKKTHLLQRTVLSESIAGDTVVGHTLAFVQNMEALHGIKVPPRLELLRSLALEMERIAIHTGDLSAFCHDLAYQLGSEVFGALRTPVINYFQFWCGNRFAKGLIRTGYNPYPFTPALKERLLKLLDDFEFKFIEMAEKAFSLPSVLNRFEKTGIVTKTQMEMIGAVGMAARMAGLKRDTRSSHPFAYYKQVPYTPILLSAGDVYARGMLRNLEVQFSIGYVRSLIELMDGLPEENNKTDFELYNKKLPANSFSISLTEGWRGEICHCVVTGEKGEIAKYKVKDPSFHNWMALALALRNNEISDFPINNKSFNLSYCGNDL
jgi:Ni,Fe-hydrogenase III large subunit